MEVCHDKTYHIQIGYWVKLVLVFWNTSFLSKLSTRNVSKVSDFLLIEFYNLHSTDHFLSVLSYRKYCKNRSVFYLLHGLVQTAVQILISLLNMCTISLLSEKEWGVEVKSHVLCFTDGYPASSTGWQCKWELFFSLRYDIVSTLTSFTINFAFIF